MVHSGRIDLATLQSLTRADDPAAILSEYGLVIVDEGHHVAAHTFARAIQSIPARRWLGLTATPKRADGRGEIMFMHCGQVRHKIPSATDLTQELHAHPTATTIRDDIYSDTPGILQSIIVPALVPDRIRTAQIIDDVVHAKYDSVGKNRHLSPREPVKPNFPEVGRPGGIAAAPGPRAGTAPRRWTNGRSYGHQRRSNAGRYRRWSREPSC